MQVRFGLKVVLESRVVDFFLNMSFLCQAYTFGLCEISNLNFMCPPFKTSTTGLRGSGGSIVLCGIFWWVVAFNKPHKIEISHSPKVYA